MEETLGLIATFVFVLVAVVAGMYVYYLIDANVGASQGA